MTIRAVFAVSHPMQYLNALEARHARGLSGRECAVLMFNKPYAEQCRQLDAVVDAADWAVARSIPYPRYWRAPGRERTTVGRLRMGCSKLASAPGFVRAIDDFLARECGALDLVATGSYLSRPHRHFLAAAEEGHGAKEIMLLDEGVSVPNFIVPLRHDPDAPEGWRFKGRFGSRDRVGRALRRLTGMRFHHPRAVTFFTLYGDIAPPASDRVEVNDFAHLRREAETFAECDEVWFLGSCFVEHGYAAAARYRALLEGVRAEFPRQPLLYLPHRYEAQENLERIAALGFTVVRSGMAVEPWLIARRVVPRRIASVVTSAVDTLAHMFAGRIAITLFRPPEGFFDSASYAAAVRDAIAGHVRHGKGAIEVREIGHAA